jgi:hypothetical protein
MKGREKFKQKLLVEGNDDLHVVLALCEKFAVQENFDIIDCKGIEKLISQIPVRLKESEIQTIGIIIDADTDIHTRWTSLKDILTNQGFEIPQNLPQEGLITQNSNHQTLGVWVMPNNKADGMLEDFIAFLVPENDKLLAKASETLANLESDNINAYAMIHKSKALIHTWLAWQESPGTPMGLGITKKYLSIDEANCLKFVNWLKDLFKNDSIIVN